MATPRLKHRQARPGERDGLKIWAKHRPEEEKGREAGFTDATVDRAGMAAELRRDAEKQRRIIAEGGDPAAVELARQRLKSCERNLAKLAARKP